jgi:hypothetical protein
MSAKLQISSTKFQTNPKIQKPMPKTQQDAEWFGICKLVTWNLSDHYAYLLDINTLY